jgi:hypothetical protein
MTGLDAVSRASYLTKENLFPIQFGRRQSPRGPPAALTKRRQPGTARQGLLNTTSILPLGAFVMRNSFLQVPQELADAARVDGASVTKSLI